MALLNVKTAYGEVQGYASADGKCSVFKSVPYAKPPVGELRFMPPQKPESWDGVKICTENPPSPMEPLDPGDDYPVNEDCLYVNIWTPAESADEKLPVMFWIYGGAFTTGYNSNPTYDGEMIARKGCILVTINYRVNVFGFFTTPEIEVKNGGPRCCGILDQIAALDWVRENITAFGGDVDRIMVFGQSAGGMSTRMLLTSPLTEGKFSRAVVHSGGGLNEGDLVRSADEFRSMCERTLEYVGWTYDDIMKADAGDVLNVMLKGVREMMNDGDLQYFQPFVDGYALTDVPGVKIFNGDYHKIDIMCGTVSGDSWMFSRKVRKDLNDNMNFFRAFALAPGVAWGRRNIEDGEPGIYSYYMDKKQSVSEKKYYTHGKPPYGSDCLHGSELPYIFGTMSVREETYGPYDEKLAEILRSFWTNFAKTGDPNGEGLPDWPKFEKGSELTMHFGDDEVKAVNLIRNEEEERVIRFNVTHPGMLTSLEGF